MREEQNPQSEERDFGVRRKNLELPPQAQARLEVIAALAVRMRETVRRLSEEWRAQVLQLENDAALRGEAFR